MPHVLVVEDNDAVASAMRLLIESGGHRVTTADSMGAGLGVAEIDPPDLALLDLTLPDGDGLSLIEPLRAAGCTRFVALTGHDDSTTRQRCTDAGCMDVMLKPVPARELLARVGAWLGE